MKVPTPGPDGGPGTEARETHEPLRAALQHWYRQRGRKLRFRGTRDPWAILVSEVMAQQTQVARVEPAWDAFMRRFPGPGALAAAPTGAVLRAWAGLGYNRRAVLLQRAARAIVEHHGGRLPERLVELEALPGVGPYTARAVAAIAFGLPVGAVDTNVRRVLARLRASPDASVGEVQPDADALADPRDPATWTHALMDLGAGVCLARDPRCADCPLRPWCRTGLQEAAGSLPAGRGPASGVHAGSATRTARAPGGLGSHPGPRFEDSSRWLRGRIVARLRELGPDEWTRLPESIGSHGSQAVGTAIQGLQRDGLVERHADGRVRLPSTPA